MSTYTLVIHGGAGTILKKDLTDELEASYRKGLEDALNAGYALLEKGKTAVEAVLAATISLENNILFNAGKGSVFGKDGRQEMDASIMDGKNLMAGAVSAVCPGLGLPAPRRLAVERPATVSHRAWRIPDAAGRQQRHRSHAFLQPESGAATGARWHVRP